MQAKLLMKTIIFGAMSLVVGCGSGDAVREDATASQVEEVRRGQLGEACGVVSLPECVEGTFCRPIDSQSDWRCMAEERASLGERCGTYSAIKCVKGTRCERDDPNEYDGYGVCVEASAECEEGTAGQSAACEEAL